MPNIDYGLCIVCKVRKARFASRTCKADRALVEAENLYDKYGIPRESKAKIAMRAKVKEYNKLIRKRLTQQQIADLWGRPLQYVRTIPYRAKREFGLAVVSADKISRSPNAPVPKPEKTIRAHKNVHGGGRWGISGCKCDLCRARVAATRAELAPGRNGRRREQRAQKNK